MFNVIDLFCGAGGLSLGFKQAGYNVLCGVDFDEPSLETYNHNMDGAIGLKEDLYNELSGYDFVRYFTINGNIPEFVATKVHNL